MADQVKMYKKLRDPKEGERFGGHVAAILFALRNGEQTREQVVKAVEQRLAKGDSPTVQPASRIVSFQTPRMIEKGLIKVTKVAAEAAKKTGKKAPAKAKAANKKKAVEQTQPEPETATTAVE